MRAPIGPLHFFTQAVPLVVHGCPFLPKGRSRSGCKAGHVLAKGRNGTPSGREVRVLDEAEGVSLIIPRGGWLWKAEPATHEGDLGHT